MSSIEALTIHLNEHEVGVITRLQGDRHVFTFNQEYVDDTNRPTLSLGFKNSYGELLREIKTTQTRLPSFFSNLLPEGEMRNYLAKQVGVKPEREFYLLAALGNDLPGAVKARPMSELSSLSEKITQQEANSDSENFFRFSLAGVQMKFSAIKKNDHGLTIAASGTDGSWIVKLPDRRFNHVPENEFVMMELARAIGIDVPETQLIPIEKIQGIPNEFIQQKTMAFAIKRFDRNNDGSRIHIEDFAQVFNVYPEKKYSQASYRNIASVVFSEVGEEGIIEFIRRFIFNLLIGNGDMHLKNWSLIYPDGHTPKLAPAYDFVSTISYIHNDAMALKFVDDKSFDSVTREQIIRFASKTFLSADLLLTVTTETVARFKDQWTAANTTLLSPEIKTAIDDHLKKLPLWLSKE